jgi:hypothetical protein
MKDRAEIQRRFMAEVEKRTGAMADALVRFQENPNAETFKDAAFPCLGKQNQPMADRPQ